MSMGFASAWAGEDLQSQDPADVWAFRQDRVTIGLHAGGGVTLQHEPQAGEVFVVLPRVGYILHELRDGVRGSLEIVAQPSYLAVFQEHTAHIWGLTALLKYNIKTDTRLTPFVEVGAGVSIAANRVSRLGSDFNFILQAAAGLQYAISDRYAVQFQYLFQHLSNADLYPSNLGLNTGSFLLGVSWLH
jgi:hypothetical protein